MSDATQVTAAVLANFAAYIVNGTPPLPNAVRHLPGHPMEMEMSELKLAIQSLNDD